MTTIIFIIIAIALMAFGATIVRLQIRVKELENDILINKQLYDSIEEQVAKLYAAIAEKNSRKNKKQF